MIGNQNASKLTKAQRDEVKFVLSQPPSEYGLPVEFWDTPKLKEYLSAAFGVEYESDRSYHYLLKFSNLSFKYPDKLSPRRNEVLIQTRVEEVRKEIKPFLTNPDWIVLASDETRLQLESEIRRAWLVKGKSLERLHLISFPPYAPEHNPIEHVWQYAKSKISNRHQQPFPIIKQDFLNTINRKTFNYKI